MSKAAWSQFLGWMRADAVREARWQRVLRYVVIAIATGVIMDLLGLFR